MPSFSSGFCSFTNTGPAKFIYEIENASNHLRFNILTILSTFRATSKYTPWMDSNRFLDNKTILDELSNVLTRIGVGDFINFIRIQPNLFLSTFHNRCGKPLLKLEWTHGWSVVDFLVLHLKILMIIPLSNGFLKSVFKAIYLQLSYSNIGEKKTTCIFIL